MRHGLTEHLARGLRQPGEHRRLHRAGRDRHDAHTEVGEVARGRQREADDAALARGVGRLADLAVVGGGAGRHDDDAAVAVDRLVLRHRLGGEAKHVERADEVDVDDRLVLLECVHALAAQDAARRGHAGAGHGDAQFTELGGGGDGGLNLSLVAHVGGDEAGALAQLCGECFALRRGQVDDDDARSGVVQAAGGGLPEARAATGDEGDGVLRDVHASNPIDWRSGFVGCVTPARTSVVEGHLGGLHRGVDGYSGCE